MLQGKKDLHKACDTHPGKQVALTQTSGRLRIPAMPCHRTASVRDWSSAAAICCLRRWQGRRAVKTFTKHVRPLKASGFQTDVRESQGSYHATDIVKETKLQISDPIQHSCEHASRFRAELPFGMVTGQERSSQSM